MRAKSIYAVLALVGSCAITQVAQQKHDLREEVAAVDHAYRNLSPASIQTYNACLAPVAREIERESPAQSQQELAAIGVKLDSPAVELPVARFDVVRRPKPIAADSIGVPLLIELDTTHAPLYPPNGLVAAGAMIYKRVGRSAHVSAVRPMPAHVAPPCPKCGESIFEPA